MTQTVPRDSTGALLSCSGTVFYRT